MTVQKPESLKILSNDITPTITHDITNIIILNKLILALSHMSKCDEREPNLQMLGKENKLNNIDNLFQSQNNKLKK